MGLLEWIKANSKEGANVAEAEQLIQASTVEGITTKEQAYDFMLKNAAFKSALDYQTGESIKTHDTKFNTEKLPGILKAEREKLEKELNPDLTPEQKRIAELEKVVNEGKIKEQENQLKSGLRAKAKELGYPEDEAERLFVYGAEATAELERKAEFLKTHVSGAVESKVKELYGGNPPPARSKVKPENVIDRSSFDALSQSERATFITSGGVVDN